MNKQQDIAHTIINNILTNYPKILSMNTHEDAHKAIVKLELGGYKKGKATHYNYPFKLEKVE